MKLVNIPSSNLDDVWSLVKKDISEALSYSGNHTDAQFVYDCIKEKKNAALGSLEQRQTYNS